MDKEKMICPLMSARDPRLANGLGHPIINCQKEDCAWWVEDKQKCAIAVMGGNKK